MKYVPENITKPESNQDAFNRAWEHALDRKAPYCARGSGDSKLCRYRKQGNCCLIGVCMPRPMALYADQQGELGAGGIHSLLTNCTSIRLWFENCDEQFLGDLQGAHDGFTGNADYRRHIKARLNDLAQSYQLQIPA